ncbi:MAG TPA: YdcF family protein [Stellaceae bacterium]|nr:YdcF family protein [Stellaceae bacterium]
MKLGEHWLAICVGAIILAWLGGFVWFVNLVARDTPPDPASTDAIVVLTGGSQRVENGLTLLAEGKAKKLFVSGVYRGTDVKALLGTTSQKPDWLKCCIELGHEADNTHGNAAETAAWMKAEHFHSLRLVTASYHMPRSMLEFSRAMPDIRIVPNPVFPAVATKDRWWLRSRAGALVIGEYMKYLFALTGLEALGPSP